MTSFVPGAPAARPMSGPGRRARPLQFLRCVPARRWLAWVGVAVAYALLALAWLRFSGASRAAPYYILAAVIALLLAWLVLQHPMLGVYLYVALVFTLRLFTDALRLLPPAFNFLPDALLCIVLARALSGRHLRRTCLDLPLCLFCAVALFSGLLNQVLGAAFLNSVLRLYLKPILIYYVLSYLRPTEAAQRRLLVLVLGLTLLQVPATIIEGLAAGLGSAGYRAWDTAAGTLGASATGVLVLLSLMAMSFLFGHALYERRPIYALAGLSLFIPMIIGEGKAGFFYAPLLLLYLLATRKGPRPQALLAVLVVTAGAYVLALIAVRRLLPESPLYQLLVNPASILTSYEVPLSSGQRTLRLGDGELTWGLVTSSLQHLLLGFGPGSASVSSWFGSGATGVLASRFQQYLPYFGSTQLTSSALEYGVLGLAVYGCMVYRVYRTSEGLLRLPLAADETALVWGARGMIFVFVAGIIYLRVWNVEVLSTFFWAVAAMLEATASRHAQDLQAA